MKLLITGGSGLLGTALTKLASKEYEVLAPTHSDLDLENFEAVSSFISTNKPDLCIHAAARVLGLGGHKLFPNASLLINSRIDINLISAFQSEPPKHFIYVGTVASYGYPYVSNALNEDNFFDGLPHIGEYGYAMAKRFGFDLASSMKDLGTSVTYAIMTNLFGPNDNFNNRTGHVIPSLISRSYESAKNKTPLEVWGKTTDTRDFLYSENAARRLLQALGAKHDGLLNIGSGIERSIESVVKSISHHFEIKDISLNNSAINSISHRVLDISKLETFFGYMPDTFEADLLQTMKWYSKNRTLARH